MDYYVKSGSLIAVLLFREKLNREFLKLTLSIKSDGKNVVCLKWLSSLRCFFNISGRERSSSRQSSPMTLFQSSSFFAGAKSITVSLSILFIRVLRPISSLLFTFSAFYALIYILKHAAMLVASGIVV